jgi:hypothetical protein
MKLIFKVLVINLLAAGMITSCYSQNCSPQLNLPKECYTVEGKVYSSSDKKYNSKRASLLLFLLGKPSNRSNGPNATILVSEDFLKMSIYYSASSNVLPEIVTFEFTLFSNELSKYNDNRKIIIYLKDNVLLSENVALSNSISIAEHFSFEMKYKNFLKFSEAKDITMQLGKTKIKLKPQHIEALNELNKTVKEFKFLTTSNIWM